ncbi:MAG: hypothetical protein R2856_18025 [Caldilineaceae bacterium]
MTTRIVQMLQDVDPTLRIGLEIDDVLCINQPLKRYDCVLTEDLLSVANQPTAKVISPSTTTNRSHRLAELPTSVRALLAVQPRADHDAPRPRPPPSPPRGPVGRVAGQRHRLRRRHQRRQCSKSAASAWLWPTPSPKSSPWPTVTVSSDEDGVAIVIEELLEMVVE